MVALVIDSSFGSDKSFANDLRESSAENSLCATIHWGSLCFLICSHTFKQCLLKNTGVCNGVPLDHWNGSARFLYFLTIFSWNLSCMHLGRSFHPVQRWSFCFHAEVFCWLQMYVHLKCMSIEKHWSLLVGDFTVAGPGFRGQWFLEKM